MLLTSLKPRWVLNEGVTRQSQFTCNANFCRILIKRLRSGHKFIIKRMLNNNSYFHDCVALTYLLCSSADTVLKPNWRTFNSWTDYSHCCSMKDSPIVDPLSNNSCVASFSPKQESENTTSGRALYLFEYAEVLWQQSICH